MNKTLKIILIASGAVLVIGGLLFAGVMIGRAFFFHNLAYGPGMMGRYSNYEGYDGAYGPGMMGGRGYDGNSSYGPGMMNGWGMQEYNGDGEGDYDCGPDMMGGQYPDHGMMGGSYSNGNDECPYGSGMMGGYGPGMMGGQYGDGGYGYGPGMMGGSGMMGGYGAYSSDEDLPILSVEQVEAAVTEYLQNFDNQSLEISEIMIFSNHAYVEVIESDTQIGAFEVLVDPVTLNITPEFGPNMMWNLKYGMHGAYQGRDEPMTVSSEEAVSLAQAYLDANETGLTVDDHAEAFYGYYTLHILEDGEVVGMLSVNGFTGDVFPHTWHGDFIEMVELEAH